jgi:predicted nuclease of predicted toxin-antitoxin system
MKLLLDQGLPRSTMAHLAALGIVAEHVGDLGMAAAADQRILDEARRKQACVVTLDADFHALLALSGARDPSVIRIRIEQFEGAPTRTALGSIDRSDQRRAYCRCRRLRDAPRNPCAAPAPLAGFVPSPDSGSALPPGNQNVPFLSARPAGMSAGRFD